VATVGSGMKSSSRRISLLRRRRTPHTTGGEESYRLGVRSVDVSLSLDGSAKGCFDLLSNCTGHPVSRVARHEIHSFVSA